jgi:hypothetical protein
MNFDASRIYGWQDFYSLLEYGTNDLLERPLEMVEISENGIVLPYLPYQIQTLRLRGSGANFPTGT